MDLTQDKIDLISKIIRNDRKFPNNEDLFDDFFNETCQRSALVFDTLENPVALETYLRKIVTTSIINVLKDSGRLRRTRTGYMPVKEVPFDTVGDVLPQANIVSEVSSPKETETVDNEEVTEFEGFGSFDMDNIDSGMPVDNSDEVNINDFFEASSDISEVNTTENKEVSIPQLSEEMSGAIETFEQTNAIENDQDNQIKSDVVDYSNYNLPYSNIQIPPTPEDVAIQKEALAFVSDTLNKIDSENESKEYLRIFNLRYYDGMTQKEIAQELGISQPEVSKRLFTLINKLKEVIEN